MILFDYKCSSCSNLFEEFQELEHLCPKCGEEAEKQIAVPKQTGLIYPVKTINHHVPINED